MNQTTEAKDKTEWINVNIKQPEEYGRYLVYRRDAGKVHFETWNTSGWAYNHNQITHWMRIPESPKS